MPITSSTESTFKNAEADLAIAYLILENPRENLFGIACFHIHQAVEKYLKGYLLHTGEQPPLIHDLKILLDRCIKHNGSLSEFSDTCKELNPYYIETRYEPGSPKDFTHEEAEEIYQKAEKIINYIKSSLDI
ncbi:HEPN domain-containing protein [Candidatus Parcubacteria bacterium]|nr:HEPN domain-containing protein [Candidatus Parcubacteria bacterium]